MVDSTAASGVSHLDSRTTGSAPAGRSRAGASIVRLLVVRLLATAAIAVACAGATGCGGTGQNDGQNPASSVPIGEVLPFGVAFDGKNAVYYPELKRTSAFLEKACAVIEEPVSHTGDLVLSANPPSLLDAATAVVPGKDVVGGAVGNLPLPAEKLEVDSVLVRYIQINEEGLRLGREFNTWLPRGSSTGKLTKLQPGKRYGLMVHVFKKGGNGPVAKLTLRTKAEDPATPADPKPGDKPADPKPEDVKPAAPGTPAEPAPPGTPAAPAPAGTPAVPAPAGTPAVPAPKE